MKKTTIILIIACLACYSFGYIFGRQDENMKQRAICEEKVAQAIQDTSDDLLEVCEYKIDQMLGQF